MFFKVRLSLSPVTFLNLLSVILVLYLHDMDMVPDDKSLLMYLMTKVALLSVLFPTGTVCLSSQLGLGLSATACEN